MAAGKSPDPADRMGVYKRLTDVPARYRLSQFAGEYDGRDVWEEFLTEYLFDRLKIGRAPTTNH